VALGKKYDLFSSRLSFVFVESTGTQMSIGTSASASNRRARFILSERRMGPAGCAATENLTERRVFGADNLLEIG